MANDIIPEWLRLDLIELRVHFRVIKKIFPWVLLVFSLLAVIMCLLMFGRQAAAAVKVEDVVTSLKGASLYVQCMTAVSIMKCFVGVITLGIIAVWPFISYLSFLLCGLLIEGLYQFFTKDTKRTIMDRNRYYKVLRKRVGRRLGITTVIIFIVVVWAFIGVIKIQELPLMGMLDVFIITIAIITPIVYIVTWFDYLWIRKTKKREGKKSRLDWYLFAKHAIRHRFKNILVAVSILAVLGWLLLPLLFAPCRWAENVTTGILQNRFDYPKKWSLLIQEGYTRKEGSIGSVDYLPAPDELRETLCCLGPLGDYQALQKLFSRFQRGMFFALTLVALCEIGIPSIANAAIYEDRRKALRKVFLATLKSSILVIGLQLLLSKAFFVDMSHALGISTVFLFAVSFFLMQESVEISSEK